MEKMKEVSEVENESEYYLGTPTRAQEDGKWMKMMEGDEDSWVEAHEALTETADN